MPVTSPLRRCGPVVVAVALLLAACGSGTAADAPEDGRPGLQLSGHVGDQAINVNDGRPRLHEGDCPLRADLPTEVCFASRTIGGTTVVVGLGNVADLPLGERIDVTETRCASPEACAAVDDGAVVLLHLDGRTVVPDRGTVTVQEAERGSRYQGRLSLRVDGSTLTGRFDVTPPPDDDAPPAPAAPGAPQPTPGEPAPADPAPGDPDD